MDLAPRCRVFATSGFRYLMALLSYKTRPSVVMVGESPPEDNSMDEDPGVSEGSQPIHLGI